MENYDKAKAARVWQRVQGAATANPTQGLPGMIAEEWGDASVYLALSKRVQGPSANILKKMSQDEQTHMACLKGIYTLQGQGRPDIPAPPPVDNAPVGLLLRRCYGRALQRLNWYAANENDPRYGHILPPLIQQTRHHTQLLLQLMTRPGIK